MNMAKANGGGGGGGMKINPLQVVMGVAQSGVNIADAVMQPKFDYGQENYTAEQAGQAEGDRAKKIANSAGGSTTGTNSDDPASRSLMGFRFSTDAGDTNWRCCMKDGTTLNNQDSNETPKTNDLKRAFTGINYM